MKKKGKRKTGIKSSYRVSKEKRNNLLRLGQVSLVACLHRFGKKETIKINQIIRKGNVEQRTWKLKGKKKESDLIRLGWVSRMGSPLWFG